MILADHDISLFDWTRGWSEGEPPLRPSTIVVLVELALDRAGNGDADVAARIVALSDNAGEADNDSSVGAKRFA